MSRNRRRTARRRTTRRRTAAARPGGTTASPLRTLRNRNARNYLAGLAASNIGTWLQITALALVVYRLTGRATNLGLMTAAGTGPILLFGPWAGGYVDRHDRRRVVIATQITMAGVAAFMGVLDLLGGVRTWIVYVIAFITGLTAAFDNPARRGLIVELVEPEDIPSALSLSTGAMMGARVFGPSLASLLITTVGTSACFLLNAASFAAVLVALVRMDRSAMRPGPRAQPGGRPVRDAVQAAWRDPVLRVAMLVTVVVSIFVFNHQVALPPLATHRWGGERAFGWVLSASGFGAVVGSLVTARQRSIGLAWHLTNIALLGVSVLALSAAPNLPVALLCAIPYGGCSASFYSAVSAIAQDRAAPEMRNRMFALAGVAFNGPMLVGGPITGFVGDHFGIGWALGYAGLAALATSAVSLPALRRSRATAQPVLA